MSVNKIWSVYVHFWYSTPYVCHYFCWQLLCTVSCEFAVCNSENSMCCVNTITCKVGLIHEQNVRKLSVAMIVAIHKILHYLSSLLLKTVLGEVDKDKNHHRSKYFITLHLQY